MNNLAPLKSVNCWVFDLDNTLYPPHNDLFSQVNERMRKFVANLLSLPEDEAHVVQKAYFREHGTTLRGLMTHHEIDPKSYLDYVHDIDLSAIAPNPALYDALNTLPGRKIIFTNASQDHAVRVMTRLGISAAFEGIYDIVDAHYRPKPDPDIYKDFISRFKIDPTCAAMIEDMPRNLKPAHELGMACVLIKSDTEWSKIDAEGPHIHHQVDDLTEWLQGLVKQT